MKLDSRILEGKRPLTCLDIEQAKEFEGKQCLFSDSYVNYKNTKEYAKYPQYTGILHIGEDKQILRSKEDYIFRNLTDGYLYSLCLPLDWIKEHEKKYRPFTLAEWIDRHKIGDIIRYRCKSQKIELRHMYVGYAYGIGTDIKNTTSGTLTLGVASYTLDYLLEDYEIEVNGEWLPFGVIDEDKEYGNECEYSC